MKISRASFIFLSLFLSALTGFFLFATLNDFHPHKAYAASDAIVIVNTLNDKDDGSCTLNDCSLREAIATATADDTIVFDVAGTIVLSPTLGDLDIAKSLTISGASVITVSGNNAVRVFNVSAGHVTFDGLKIISGTSCCGSGIYNGDSGIVAVNNSILSENSASNSGAILNRGTMTVSNSILSDNEAINCGGGIQNTPYDARLLIINSTISGNKANCGGGIINNGTVTLSNSTISENKAGIGGGIYNSVNGTMLINNSTLFNNSSSSSSGTIHNLSTVTMMNSILANSPDNDNCDSHIDIISNGNNIDSDDSCNLNKFSDITNVDPLLAPLTNNAGDTKTHLLLAGSPAINEGNCSNSPATDQRGVARPQNTSCDIGAVEMVPCIHSITVLNSNSKNAGSLRQALSDICDGGIVTFDNDVANSTIDISPEGELLIYKSLTISSTVPITISGNNTTRVFNVMTNTVSPNVNVTFDSLNIVNGNVQTNDCGDLGSSKCGGGIILQNSGVAVTVTKSTLAGNTAENGGGIYNFGTVMVKNSTLSGNKAITNGGGIDNVGILNVTNSTIAYNSADVLGGGIHNITDTVTVNHSVIANSTSGSDCDGTAITSAGYNLDSDDSCNLYAGGDIVNANPNLGPLTDNGGNTLTYALLAGSPAIDAGGATCVDIDQRGILRPIGGRCDIGAFESNAYLLTVNEVGSGSVMQDPERTDYAYDTVVNVTGVADPGWS